MSGTESIGEAVQAALTARALEPAAGGPDDDGHNHERACLNCGTALLGSHCHACGQAAHAHKTLGAFLHDLLHGVFHFEGKIWRTIPALLFRPGKLTREYVDGRRASYVSPIALFLFCTFVTFAVVRQYGLDLSSVTTVEVDGIRAKGMEANQQELARLRKSRAELSRQGRSTEDIDGEIAAREAAIRMLEKMRNPGKAELSIDKNLDLSTNVEAIDRTVESLRSNPQLVLYKLQSNAYKFAWALIPISVPLVWLLFAFRRRFGLYDHTVFVTYSLCFMLLLVSLLTLGLAAGLPGMGLAFALIPPLHIFLQLRGTYELGRFGALWRTAAVVAIAFAVLALFAALILYESGA